jgi:hypothetical protein
MVVSRWSFEGCEYSRTFLTTNDQPTDDWRPTTHLWLFTYPEPLKKNKSRSTN